MKKPSDSPPPSYHHGHLKEALLDQALIMVSQSGVKGWSLREIAKELGVSTAAPYKHFKDKEELLATLAQRGFGLLMAEEERADPGSAAGWNGVIAACMAYFDFAQRHPGYLDVMFDCLKTGPYPELLNAAHESFEALRLRVAKAEGPTSDGALTTTRGWWALTHGLSYLANRNVLAVEAGSVTLREIALERLRAQLPVGANKDSAPDRGTE